MKHKVTTIALVGALTLGGASAAYAQGTSPTTAVPTVAPRATTGTTAGTTGSTAGVNTTQVPVDHDDGMDWGWLGLFGLAGLAPLFMRRRQDEVVHRTDTTVDADEPRVRRVA